jgi:arylsulfatase A-like enzyme
LRTGHTATLQVALCALLLVAFVVPACGELDESHPEASAPARMPMPNLVLITIDTLRADHLGCYGYADAQTPNIDRLAASSIRFALATTVTNNTLPSHAAILTGKYPQNLGIPRNGFKLVSGHETLATTLKRKGYDTAAFISASALSSRMGLDVGFDLYDESFDTKEIDQVQRRAPATTRRAVEWIEARGGSPFFAWVHYFDPHYPYTPPPPYDTLFYPEYDGAADGSIPYICGVAGVKGFPKLATTPDDLRKLIALYDGEIAFLDASLEPLFSILEREEHRSNTMVILTADHGESLVEHNYFFDHGGYAYQPSMHVPLIFRFPGTQRDESGRVVEEQVQTIDVFATALAGLGVDVPGEVDGRDLAPLLRAEEAPGQVASFGESCRPWAVEKRHPGKWPNLSKAQFVLRYPWKLILTPYLQRVDLYNLADDREETVNLADARPELAHRLTRELSAWRERGSSAAPEVDLENIERLRALGYVE